MSGLSRYFVAGGHESTPHPDGPLTADGPDRLVCFQDYDPAADPSSYLWPCPTARAAIDAEEGAQ